VITNENICKLFNDVFDMVTVSDGGFDCSFEKHFEDIYFGVTEALFWNFPEGFQENMKSFRIADVSEQFCRNEGPERYI
jgi:hypothetical protein